MHDHGFGVTALVGTGALYPDYSQSYSALRPVSALRSYAGSEPRRRHVFQHH